MATNSSSSADHVTRKLYLAVSMAVLMSPSLPLLYGGENVSHVHSRLPAGGWQAVGVVGQGITGHLHWDDLGLLGVL